MPPQNLPASGTSANRIVMKNDTAEVFVYDYIGPSDWGYVGAKDFVAALRQLGDVKSIDVRINSGGGHCFEAMAIYNALSNHSAQINVFIDGLAASAASVIAMAGDTISIAENAMIMIHQATGSVWGTADEMRREAGMIDQLNVSVVNLYAARTKLPANDVKAMVDAETWFDAKAAVEKGFATAIVPNKSVSARVDLSQFKNVPDWCRRALSQMKGEPPVPEQTPTPATPPATQQPATAPANTLPAAPVATVPAGAVTMTTAELRAFVDNAVNAARLRDSEIDAVCTRAGVPEMAADFKADPKIQLSDVKDRMIDVLCAKNVPLGDGGTNPAAGTKATPEAQYEAEWAAHEELYLGQGLTKEIYMKSRAITDKKHVSLNSLKE